jgi:transposase-like protein
MERDCPECGATEFRLIARTRLHLGEKAKFRCSECDYGFVRIDGAVDTSTA